MPPAPKDCPAPSRRDFLRGASTALLGLALPLAGCGAATRRAPGTPGASLRTTLPDDALQGHDALALAADLRAGEFSPAELLEIVIDRIERLDPRFGFMTTRAYERARTRARTLSSASPFAGVPFLVKDMIDVAGIRRTDGSNLFANRVPARSVAYIEAIEAAGLNIVGLTNAPEFASLVVTDNDRFGPTRNPWNPAYSTLTSSGGAAAAVATGVVPMAHGTDGAGSCRLPASTTGLLGMKPSRGRMRSGEADGGHDRAKTNQVLSRSVRDSAALFAETEDPATPFAERIGRVTGPSTRRLRVGLVRTLPGAIPISPDVSTALEATTRLLADLGHRVTEVPDPVDPEAFQRAYDAFVTRRLRGLGALAERRSGRSAADSGLLTRFVATFVERAQTREESALARDLAYLDSLPARYARLFEEVDVLLTPVCPVAGVRLDAARPDDVASEERIRFTLGHLRFTGPVNFAGNPAMSVPLGWNGADGLPIGSHFVAALGGDRLLYALAYELEAAQPWKDRWAPGARAAPTSDD